MSITETEIIQIASTIAIFIAYPLLRTLVKKLTVGYSKRNSISKARTKMIQKQISYLINIGLIIMIVIVWGVDPKNILVALSSIFAVIGVALFAQWSILSNITSGIILFFSTPLRIGDRIKIHDGDFPIEAEIKDIRAFHMYLQTKDGEKIMYPNNVIQQKGIAFISREDALKKEKTELKNAENINNNTSAKPLD